MLIGSSPLPLAPSEIGHRWLMLAGAWLLYFSFGIMIAALAPLVQPITLEFGSSYSTMGAIFGAWQLGYVVFAVPCGALLDRVGLHIALFACALIMALSGFLRAMAGSELSLFLAVAIFGIGAPLISVGGPKLIATWFDSKERGLAMGIFSTGPPLGGILAFSLTNSTFMPLADGNWRLVVLGYSLFVLAIAAVWLMIGANRFSRPLEQQIAADPKQSQLDVIRHLLQIPAVRIILLMSAGIFFFNQALNNWLPEILRSGGMDVVTAGYWASIPTSIGIAASLIVPHFATSSRRFIILFIVFLCAGLATLLIGYSALAIGLMVGLVFQGIARGVMRPILVLVLIETREVGPRNAGSAGGMFFSIAEIGGALGSIVVGLLFDATGGFLAALNVLTAICALLILMLVLLRRTPSLH